MNHSVLVAVIDALKDLLDAMRGVRFAVKLSGHNVFEELTSRHPNTNCPHYLVFKYLKNELTNQRRGSESSPPVCCHGAGLDNQKTGIINKILKATGKKF